MSHSVTIPRSTTSSSGNPLLVNTRYLVTLPGLLKIVQLVLGATCVGIVANKINPFYSRFYGQKPEVFFLVTSVTFLIGTFCLLLSYVISRSTASMISQTLYGVIYHGVAFILYLAAAVTLIIGTNYRRAFTPFLVVGIMGLVMAGLYFYSTFLAYRKYRERHQQTSIHTSGQA